MNYVVDDETDYFDYDGEKVQAHYSSLTLHRKCPEAWFYRYGLNIRNAPSGEPMPYLHAGSWWGALRAADIYERGRQVGSLLPIARPFKGVDSMPDGTEAPRFDPETVTRKDILRAALVWWQLLPTEHKDVWMEKIGKPLVPHLIYTFEQWKERYGAETMKERPLGAEVFWKRRLPRPESDSAWGQGEVLPEMWLLGYIDELYEDTERGLIVVRDHKFNSNLGLHTVIDDMMDSQLELYAWGAQPIVDKFGLGAIRAVAYDRAKSVAPKPPTLTTAGKLASRGGEPSVNSSDLRTYLHWAGGEDGEGRPWRGAAYPRNAAEKADPSLPTRYKEGGIYKPEEAIIAKLSSEGQRAQWFQRKLIPLNGHVVKAHLRAAIDSATDIYRTSKRAEITGGASRNLSNAGCRFCDYQNLCQARMRGGNQGVYDLREFGLVSTRGTVLAGGVIEE
ncbi:hypothetical protein PBI_DEWDROP_120 [Microbacterium phage Dewdrop]|nr:hypothetical protein PBI_LEAF_120 [Microbacterium phage Leaf]QGZ17488.1 hypothetical protein PBI_DEWDROP_120 [Microbacterium phage Dewdrop]